MSNKKILVAEISGKRAGDFHNRPTEKFIWNYDKVIISNDSDGYITDWPIINVPDDYREWYKKSARTSDKAWLAPMNRSYAIKYAREHGYDYLVQLDDNITSIDIAYRISDGRKYSTIAKTKHREQLPNDMIGYMADVLDCTNAGIVGMSCESASIPANDWLCERYVYSFFIMNLACTKEWYQGDFEDDIEYRLKLKQKKIPVLSVAPFRYSKTSQQTKGKNTDLSGNRQAYVEAGLQRGEHMSILYGDYYSAGLSIRGSGLKKNKQYGARFRHKLKPFKVGVRCKNLDYLKDQMLGIFFKYATKKKDALKVSVSHMKLKILIRKNYYTTLTEIVKLCVVYNVQLDNNDNQEYFVFSSADSRKFEEFKEKLGEKEGVQIIG